MNLTKKEQAEVSKVYETWLNSYLNGDVKTYDSYFDDRYRFIGSTSNEDFLNRNDTTRFFEVTADQLAGKVEIRNNRRTLEKFDELIFITDLFDAYFLNGNNWEYYEKFRFTSILKKTNDDWRFVYQHFSTPDSKAQEGETIGTEQIAAENLMLREAVKRRTTELEQKNRELEIETALEKVRSRTMGMQSSDELPEVANLLFLEIQALGIPAWSAGYCIWNEEKSAATAFMSSEGVIQKPFSLPAVGVGYNFQDPLQNGESFHVSELGGEEIAKHYEFMRTLPVFGEVIDGIIEAGFPLPTFQIFHIVYFPQGYLMFITYEKVPESHNIFKRFTNVFEQTYTRFLDLQKAEAQARESQIQLALERVRARTMAMQRSEELADVALVLFQQVKQLGIETWSTGFNVWLEGETSYIDWVVSTAEGRFIEPYTVDLTAHPFILEISKAKKRGDDFFMIEAEGETLAETYRLLFKMAKIQFEDLLNAGFQMPEHQINHYVFGKQVSLMFITFDPCPEAHDIFKRLGKAFEQTYTRFLDLQKAEAQARESQIQLALERVRASAMAMQKSEELADASFLLDSQVRSLGIKTRGCAFNIYGENESTEWFSSEAGTMPTYKTPRENIFLRYYEAGQSGKTMHIEEFDGETCINHYDYLCTLPVMGDALKKMKESGGSFPLRQIDHVIYFKYGYLLFITLEHVPEAHDIFKRFAKVFEQTYTRFLDLQKAEAQAREAQIEAALERLRARSMGMHKSEELIEVVRLLDKEIKGLGVQVNGSQIVTDFANPEDGLNDWFATEGQDYLEKFHIPYLEHPLNKRVYSALHKGVDFYTENYSKAEKNKYFRLLFKYSDFRNTPKERQEFVYNSPAWIRAVVVSKNSILIFQRYEFKEFTKEEEGIFKRFGKVFEQAYTRFLDLQKAEAQAREAQIEAALERVRSRTMGMQKSIELAEVIAQINAEITNLGIRSDNTGLITDIKLNEKSGSYCTWFSIPGKTYSNKFLIPRMQHRNRLFEKMEEAYQKKIEFFTISFTKEEKDRYLNFVFAESDLKSIPESRKEFLLNAPGWSQSVVLHKNSGLALQRFSNEVFSEEENAVAIRFGHVFEQTYTRFLDLQKAEAQAREAQIEAALERVRAKAMSMQNSEDLNATIGAFYRELEQFSITPRRCGVGLLQKNRLAELSTMNTMEQGNSIEIIGKLKMEGHWVLDGVYDNWILQKEFHPVLRGNEIKEYNKILKPQMDFPEYPNNTVQFGYFFFFPEGGVYAWTEKEMKEDELNIYRKFTTVLSLTYKRYKDLKDAEANAHEAVRRASLDRVRAEIASMRTVDDLQRITPIIWHELTVLGVPFVRCGVFIMNEETGHIQVYLSAPDGHSLAALDLSFHSSKLAINTVDHWRQGIIFKTHWNKQEFINWMKSMIELGQVSNRETYQGAAQPPETLHLHFVPFKQGMLYVGNTSPLEKEALELVKALAESFSIAFARYEDFKQLETAKNQIEKTLSELKSTQAQLIQAEKMASLGELTAGIAHEIQNPLNFVNNFSELSNELMEEMKEELAVGNVQFANEIAGDILQNLQKINHHGKRAADIVKGMLLHSRTSNGQKEPTDINALADEYLRLSYHGLRAKDKSFNADFKTNFDPNLPKINVIPQDIGRVLLNLINNAFYVVSEKAKLKIEGYKPEVIVKTSLIPPSGASPGLSGGGGASVSVIDNGPGIPPEIKDKIFQPFFTTKPTGQGTGLGLSLSYDIVKAHGGELRVETEVGLGTTFIILLISD